MLDLKQIPIYKNILIFRIIAIIPFYYFPYWEKISYLKK